MSVDSFSYCQACREIIYHNYSSIQPEGTGGGEQCKERSSGYGAPHSSLAQPDIPSASHPNPCTNHFTSYTSYQRE